MREIKFRAYAKPVKMLVPIINIDFENKECLVDLSVERGDLWGYHFHEVELMQFTGVHDKNNNEVYESDIIEDDLEYLAVVKFGEHLTSTDYYASTAYGWYAERVNGDTHSLAQCGTITVRGNIHEHPHLLERSVEE